MKPKYFHPQRKSSTFSGRQVGRAIDELARIQQLALADRSFPLAFGIAVATLRGELMRLAANLRPRGDTCLRVIQSLRSAREATQEAELAEVSG